MWVLFLGLALLVYNKPVIALFIFLLRSTNLLDRIADIGLNRVMVVRAYEKKHIFFNPFNLVLICVCCSY